MLASQFVSSQHFLTGNIYKKLEMYESLHQKDGGYQKEIEALKSAIPAKVPIDEIDIKIGAAWIPINLYEQFCEEILGVPVKIFYSDFLGLWNVEVLKPAWIDNSRNRDDFGISSGGSRYYGVSNKPSESLFTMLLEFKSPIMDSADSMTGKLSKDEKLTLRAIAKQESLNTAFAAWCIESEQRAEVLENIYNRNFNAYRRISWDGTGDILKTNGVLQRAGMSPLWQGYLRSYQLDVIWRGCGAKSNLLVGLEVGLGKTICAAAIAMLRKYYKLSQKTMIVVQGSTLEQFEDAFREAFPLAKVLCASKKDSQSFENRQNFLATAAFMDLDAIILTHEMFRRIPVRKATELSYVSNYLETVETEVYRLHSLGESAKRKGKKPGNRILKDLERLRNTLKEKKKLLEVARDTGICWENLGIDYLIIDESQKYKNNFVSTKMSNIAGINPTSSARSEDFDLKSSYMRDKYGDGYLCFMTGTPEPTNSPIGLFVYQRYLQMPALKECGIAHFDSWISNFGRITTEYEFKADGGLRPTERVSEWVNLPELINMWLAVAHIKRFDDVKDQTDNFDRPKAVFKRVMVEMSDEQLDFMHQIEIRYYAVRKGRPFTYAAKTKDGVLQTLDPETGRLIPLLHPVTGLPIRETKEADGLNLRYATRVDCFLKLAGDVRKSAIAHQFIDPSLPVEPTDKIALACKRIFKWWKITQEARSTQLVFLDMGTPTGSAQFMPYFWMRDNLIDRGIPAHEIAFIHDYDSGEQRRDLFEKVNNGEIRILFGSTEKMGVGVNVQKKVKVLHLIDIPYRPDLYEQRLGRAIRFGNENSEVLVYQYLTKGANGNYGANAFELQLLERKIKMRNDLLRGDASVRRMTDEATSTELFMMLKAHSCGDPRIIELTTLKADISKKEAKLQNTIRQINRIRSSTQSGIPAVEKSIQEWSLKIPPLQRVVDDIKASPVSYENFLMRIGDQEFTNPRKANEALVELGRQLSDRFNSATSRHAQVDSYRAIASIGCMEMDLQIKQFQSKSHLILTLVHRQTKLPFHVAWRTSEQRLIKGILEAYNTASRDLSCFSNLLADADRQLLNLRVELQKQRAIKDTLIAEIEEMKANHSALETALNMVQDAGIPA